MPSPTITVRVSHELHASLKNEAETSGRSLTDVVVEKLTVATHSSSGTTVVTGALSTQDVYPPTPTSTGTADPTTTPQTTGMTVPSPAPKPTEVPVVKAGMAQAADRVLDTRPGFESSPPEPSVSERDVRHLSPTAMPDREKVRDGYTVAEDTCEHPRASRQQFSYMTRCGLCGRRLL